jgi:hypothetical protein
MKSPTKFVGQYIALSMVAGVALLVYSFPKHPTTWLGWAALFGFALPILVIGEFVGDLVLSRNPFSRAIESRTKGKAFSWVRIGYFLTLFLLVGAAFVALNHWLNLGL